MILVIIILIAIIIAIFVMIVTIINDYCNNNNCFLYDFLQYFYGNNYYYHWKDSGQESKLICFVLSDQKIVQEQNSCFIISRWPCFQQHLIINISYHLLILVDGYWNKAEGVKVINTDLFCFQTLTLNTQIILNFVYNLWHCKALKCANYWLSRVNKHFQGVGRKQRDLYHFIS